jgi:2-succinyl-6-hydroxy-2,4-cyclohexadiene-1-carboxylate synthase
VPESLVLLHGFGGTCHAWDRVIAQLDPERYRPLALDLPGHGEAASYAGPITLAACVEAVLAVSPERFALCGYSLGGRVALGVALAAPERVSRLILVSSSPGIEDADERAQRKAADEELAEDLERAPFEEFIERWQAQPLFAEDPREVSLLAREDQRRNSPLALAAAMRGLGAGAMQPLWEQLSSLKMPVAIVAGNHDQKYKRLGELMLKRLTEGQLIIVPGGHRLPLESPRALGAAIDSSRSR